MCGFEEKVKKNLINCNVCLDGSQKIGVAVSGGADSISLLLSLSSFISPLYVITVNHNIRPAEESRGDADFVLETCEKLKNEGCKIICKVVELEPGAVAAEADKRGGGTEDAARYLRYQAFEKFIADNDLSALCLAHNRNDQLETLLMRFLQGSPAESAGGIQARRGPFVRPLLDISRSEIEEYVTARGFSWRTDKSNFETDYLRNRIRHKLLPFLDQNFEGWQTAVLKGAEKASEDSEFIQSFLADFQFTLSQDGSVQLSLSDFLKAPDALKYRLLLEACNRAGESSRIPHNFLKDVISSLENGPESSFSKRFGSVEIIKEKENLFVKKVSESNTDLFFSDIIEKTGTFEFPFGLLNVFNYREEAGKAYVSLSVESRKGQGQKSLVEAVSLPFYVRSLAAGDTLLAADGSEKKASDILSDWHVAASDRNLLPVIQLLDEKPQRIKALLAGFSGYKDWIVKL